MESTKKCTECTCWAWKIQGLLRSLEFKRFFCQIVRLPPGVVLINKDGIESKKSYKEEMESHNNV